MSAVSPRRAVAASTGARQVAFTFDGRRYAGFAGDTLASALLANGVRLFGRSFKYHRPRGLLARRFRGAERARVGRTRCGAMHAERARDAGRDLRGTRRREPESLACARFRRDGPQRPVRAAACPAAFYYKTFMWPRFGLAPLVRACHTPRSRARSRAVCAGSRSLRPAVRALRRARRRRRPGGPRCRARARQRPAHGSCFATSSPNSVARCSTSTPRRSTASRRNNGSPLRSRRSPRVRT